MGQRLKLTYRVRAADGEVLDIESVFRDAGVAVADRPWRPKHLLSETFSGCVNVDEREIHGRYDPDYVFSPLVDIFDFAEYCRKRFELLFEREDIADHELFVGMVLQDPNESAALDFSRDRVERLHCLGLSLGLTVYQCEHERPHPR